MAGAQFSDITQKILSRGIDDYSSKANIPEGYVEDMENFDTNASGLIRTRKGYVSHSGWLPIRVTKVVHVGYNIRYYLDTSQSIDLASTTVYSLLAYGRLSSTISATGALTSTNGCDWMDSVTVINRETISAGSNTLSKSASDHGLTTANMFVGFAESDSTTDNSNTLLVPDEVAINTSTYNVDIDYTAVDAGEGFIYVADKDAVSGEVYVHTVTASTSETVNFSTHGLNNNYIQVRCYDTSGGEYIEVIPDTLTIDASGNVVATFSTAITGVMILSVADLDKVETTSAVVGSNTFTISNPGSAFNFIDIYAYNGGTSKFDLVIPDSTSYDESADEITISYTVSAAAETVEIYYENASVVSNIIEYEDSVSENYTDTNPQVTVWGIPHEGIYRSTTDRGGHVSHIDSYRRVGESRVVAGLGGNMFASRTREEVGSSHCLPSSYAHLRARLNGDFVIAPLFQTTALSRTRGDVVDTAVDSNHKITVTAATYVSDTQTDYTLSFDSAATLTGKIGTYDEFTVSGMPYSELNGTFVFESVSSDATTAPVIRLTNSSSNARFDVTGTAGKAGCFTDTLTVNAGDMLQTMAGDIVTTGSITSADTLEVVSQNYTDVYLRGVTRAIEYPDNLQLGFKSTRRLIMLRTDDTSTISSSDHVSGDMVGITGYSRKARVDIAHGGAPVWVDITGDGTTATITFQTANQNTVQAGQTILIAGCAVDGFNGEVTLTEVPTTTTATFASTTSGTDSSTQTLVSGSSVYLDEAVLVNDSGAGTAIAVASRWIPVEAPEDSFDLTTENYIKHFDTSSYSDQPVMRSTMVNDNMYMVNGDDEVMKFDGTNVYRAGLFKWQPHMFTDIDTSTGSITVNTVSAAFSSINGKVFEMTTASDAGLYRPGDRVESSNDNARYTVVEVDAVAGQVEVDRNVSGAAGNLTGITLYTYYFRLNAIDANQNIIASAVTSSNGDCQVELGAAAQIKHRLVGLPAWDIYDYDRLEVQMYRTKADSVAPFYLMQTVLMDFDNYDGYIDLVDSTPDFVLTTADLDPTNTALLGAELGIGWDEPIRSKYITSTNNRLVLANCTGYPQLDIVINKKVQEDLIEASDLHGKIFTFRKDSTSTSTTTDMTNVVKYEFIDVASASPTTITPASDITSTADTFTIADAAHTLVAGDWVYLYHAAAGAVNTLTFAGWYQVDSVSAGVSFTINMSNHGRSTGGGTAADVDTYLTGTAPADVPVLLGTDGNYNQKDGNITTTYESKAMLRLANAINTTMRVTDVGVETGFTPWMVAKAGNDYTRGQLIIRQPKVFSTSAEVVLPTWTTSDPFDVYVHGVRRSSAAEVAVATSLFPSRVLLSYPNFPEIFDNPEVVQDIYSTSAVDVNAADGQAITALITFFGESTFGAAQLNDALVVFKENSIYLLNSETGQYQKIDSRGLGCDAPRSVAATRNGIMFANRSGVYRLNRNMTISYVGKFNERYWRDTVNKDQISEITGHQYGIGRTYKLSVPVGSGSYCSKVLVYNHDTEGQGQEFGSWTRYSNHAATGWCNLQNDAFFGSTSGDVFKVRNENEAADYRDDDAAITATVTTRGDDFGIPGVRKLIGGAFLNMQLDTTDVTGLTVATSMDLKDSFTASGTITATLAANPYVTAKLSLPSRRGTNVSTKITHSVKDEEVIITGLSYRVGRLSPEGIKEAADYT
ncbi:hypothetical protein OAF54_00050 [bacterium]|nr:hypothetical protein [bacterium]